MDCYRGYGIQYNMTDRGYDVTICWTAPEMSLGLSTDRGIIIQTQMFDLDAVHDIIRAYLDEAVAYNRASFKAHVELIEKASLA